ncbi:hypothetical protein FOZ62_016110, partial [Perkinsus olseni]
EPCSSSRKLVGYQYHGLRRDEEAAVLSKRGTMCHTVFASRDLAVVKGRSYVIADDGDRGGHKLMATYYPTLYRADANAWHAWQRGETLVRWCLDREVRILNDEVSLPTFESNRYQS